MQIIGTNFGNSVSEVTGRVFFNGPSGQESDNILSWTNTTILARVPTALLVNQTFEVIVANAGGSSSQPVTYTTQPGTTCSTPEPAPRDRSLGPRRDRDADSVGTHRDVR